MSRLTVNTASRAQGVMDGLCADMTRRLQANPAGNCPVDLTAGFVRACMAQSCGKCTPCRVGLEKLYTMIDGLLKGEACDLAFLEKTARVISESADCAIGAEAAEFVLNSVAAFRDDYEAHAKYGACSAEFKSVPCVEGCPAHVDIPGYIALVKAGRCEDAIRLIRKDNPFPSACALICEHPCEAKCRRKMVDDAVNIRGLKRFAVDEALKNGEYVAAPKANKASGKTVAVIGGGPAGLTTAYFLALMGHKATIFEAREKLGGMLRYGIPVYRLPDSYLDADIDTILSLGVEVKTGVKVGENVTLDELRKNYDSVYISIGAHTDKKLHIDGEDKKGVMSAVKLLRAVGSGERPDFTGKKVVIVGGGNVAMDATRTSKRLGAESVRCVYRRRIEDMTALPDEIAGAQAEGCEIMQLLAPVRIAYNEKEEATGLVVQPQIIGDFDRGRPAPRAAQKAEEVIPADIIVVAIGQNIESGYFEKEGVEAKRGAFLAGPDGAVKGMPGVFAGGDCVSGPATVIRAIDAGKVAAANIDRYFGFNNEISVDVEIPAASYESKAACGRVNLTEKEAAERAGNFNLMENNMSREEACQECSRCLRCDHYGMGAMKGGRVSKW